ncbi:PilC/PilY family type IV pilus protein [Thermodesulforhabdus norvegica]|uniref:von Willebrand factor type A domain-containing protein n=1 Tax=Thermodesulforhabdus norvegica TaxID=39841 RepID=A0A1I4U0A9_9BACT|nr:PilC/PilY family type IV pilus protein [Thermodesulforhabdus norvegica]SFM82315.1 von Willebrand factor type A domain-containing protein [Thermodesulforhabdus norvegica]
MRGSKKNVKKLWPWVLIIVGIALASYGLLRTSGNAFADEDSVCGEVPLYLGRYVAPDILMIVDLSGSMGYGLRPDWSPVYDPSTTYQGHYTDLGREGYVYNRRAYYDSGYFVVYPCWESPDDINRTPLNSHCPGTANPRSVYIDDILENYGIAEWSYHDDHDTPPYASQEIPKLYENDTVLLGNYLNTTRIEVVANAIKRLVADASLAMGLGFFKATFGQYANYTRIYEGVEAFSEEHFQELVDAIDNVAHEPISGCDGCYRVHAMQGTPFSPSIIAARKYFNRQKPDVDGDYYTPGRCSKKFVIFLTDGIGNIDSTVDNVRQRTIDLVQSGVTPIAVGFNLPEDEDSQLREMARVANQYADGDNTYALHKDNDNDGVPDPYIARNPQELAETLREIIYEIKQTVFKTGSGAARRTALGNTVVYTAFNLTDWTGEVSTSSFTYGCANCHSPSEVRNLARWNYFTDEDGDGKLDILDEDRDGDGKLDTEYEDRDSDGHLDVDEDTNGNGQLDPGEDVDGDGNLDVAEDLDGDGHLDIPEDMDGDGNLDKPEPINYEALQQFLENEDQVRDKMGEGALVNYSVGKIESIIKILKGELPDAEWWSMEDGWNTTSTLPCGETRNIKYQNGTQLLDFTGAVGGLTEDQVKFIRGEMGCGDMPQGDFRLRERPLGDIISSEPRISGDLIWVTANDGMLHAFDVNTGEEKFAFIPESVLSRYLTSNYFYNSYCHEFFFDGTPTIQEVGNSTYLVVGLGRGGSEYFAFDITNAPDSVSLKWHVSDPGLGETWNEVKFVRCGESDWRVFLPSGYVEDPELWANQKAFLKAVNIDSGSEIATVYLGSEGANMPATPGSAVDLNEDLTADRLYVGDLLGRMWRLSDPCTGTISSEAVIDLGSDHPITASVTAAATNNGVWLYFGTGKYWDIDDLTDNTEQYLIGMRDSGTTLTLGDLEDRGFTTEGEYRITDSSTSCTLATNGWKVTLTGGERVITPPLLFGGYVFFLTFVPTGDECEGTGETWLYGLPARRGCLNELDQPLFDINNDGLFDENDLVEGKPPVAMKLGSGVPGSEPVVLTEQVIVATTTETSRQIRVNVKPITLRQGTWTDVDVQMK